MMDEISDWFRWERLSTIHSLFIPLEAAMKPLRHYFGRSWPLTILVYTKNRVLWCNKISELHSLGQEMIKYYSIKSNERKLLQDVRRETKNLKEVFSLIRRLDLRTLSNKKLLQLYQRFRRIYINWYKLGWTTEPVEIAGERLLRNILKSKKSDKYTMLTLTHPTRITFTLSYQLKLLELLRRILEDKNIRVRPGSPAFTLDYLKRTSPKVFSLLRKHSRRFFWMGNNYYEVRVLDEGFFLEEIKKLYKKTREPEKEIEKIHRELKQLKQDKSRIFANLHFSKEEKRIVGLIELFGWLKDFRKRYIMEADHCLDLLLVEIGKRSSLSKREMRYTLPSDIPLLLKGGDLKGELSGRMKNCIVVWPEHSDTYEFYTGKKAKERERGLFKIKFKRKAKEIRGIVASKGKARGVARVILQPNKAMSMKKGDILVTTMTSPEFTFAIEKAAAIVTDEGGITCHAAIISREKGIPCVIATKEATRLIHSGALIEVDADNGVVRILNNINDK